MSKHTQGIQDLRWFVSRFRGILSLADELENLGSIEDNTSAAQTRLTVLQDQITGETERSSQKIAAAHQEAIKIENEAKQNVAQIIAYAEADAATIRTKAD